MAISAGLVIVGGGQAGFQAAVSARAAGYQEPVTIIAREAELPYQRPPLSKAYLLGKQRREGLALQKAAFYDSQGIKLRKGSEVAAIHRQVGDVALAGGERIPFRHLVLATGGRCRVLPVPGAALDGVLSLRNLADADRLSERVSEAKDVVVVGGGFIGLEFAAVAKTLGKDVTVIEALPGLMARAVATPVSDYFRRLHETRGVRVLLGSSVDRFEGEGGQVARVVLRDGTSRSADLVLVGIGVVAETELATAAGLSVSTGIDVDATLRTSDPRIFAIGDCAAFCVADLGRLTIESVSNAVDQARYVGATITGQSAPFSAVPWFWSDQYDHKLQMAGLSLGCDRHVVRGDPKAGAFSVFSYRRGRLAAVDSVGRPLDHALARKMLSAGASLTAEEAGDETLDIRALFNSRLAA